MPLTPHVMVWKAILEAGSYDLGPKTGRIESPEAWSVEKIHETRSSYQQ